MQGRHWKTLSVTLYIILVVSTLRPPQATVTLGLLVELSHTGSLSLQLEVCKTEKVRARCCDVAHA
jgi:hypothetical protein